VWFTLSHGILDEIYYPRVDYACTRNFGLIVTDGRGYFSEEKRDAASMIRPVDDGVPAFMLRNVSRDGRYVQHLPSRREHTNLTRQKHCDIHWPQRPAATLVPGDEFICPTSDENLRC